MRSLAVALALAAALPAAAQQAAAGAVRADRAAVEILPPRAGASELRTPEGFLRVEGGMIGASSGTFGVYPAGAYGAGTSTGGVTGGAYGAGARPPPPSVAAAPQPQPELAPAGPPAGLERCRPERTRYLRRLLYFVGIDVDDPLALVDGIAGAPGAASGSFLFTAYGALGGLEPLRPLAWDQELRSLGRELAACQRGLER